MAKFDHNRPAIKHRQDLRDYLYWTIGTLTMDEINGMVDIIVQYEPLCKANTEEPQK